jgi:hypothetical protein
MAHEVTDLQPLFAEILGALKSDAVFLLVEPKIHVASRGYREIVAIAEAAGLKPSGEVSVRLSRATVFRGS